MLIIIPYRTLLQYFLFIYLQLFYIIINYDYSILLSITIILYTIILYYYQLLLFYIIINYDSKLLISEVLLICKIGCGWVWVGEWKIFEGK